ncbi:MAG: hypothetical protein LBH22_08385 [Bacteroidales bacterium]|jgi:hypothetical protein|nr:hypothetical protein [Bacteroidales bacterium]
MYLAGHLLASITLAKIVHKPLGLKFFPLAIAAMAVNLIDADHLIYYYRDSGIGNSFLLHPLHQAWAFLGLAVCLLALVLKTWQNLIFGIFFALMLHYGLDLLGNLVNYNLEFILGFEVLCLAVLMVLFRKDEQRLKYYIFFVSLWLVCNAVLGFQTMILHWQPNETRGIYLTSVILNVMFVAIFWILFKPKNE